MVIGNNGNTGRHRLLPAVVSRRRWPLVISVPVGVVVFLVSIVLIAVLITVAAVAYVIALGGAALWGLVRPRAKGISRRQTVRATVAAFNAFVVKIRPRRTRDEYDPGLASNPAA